MIVLYRGSRGKGKTLTMVKDAYKFYKNKYKVLSNLELKFGEYISSKDIVGLNKRSDLRDCVLVIDEIELFFDSRAFSKPENRTFSHFLQQIRKRNIIILCTSQYTNLIDLRIRQQLDVVVYPKYDKENHMCKCSYFNLTELEDSFGPVVFNPIYIIYDAKEIYKMYDTYQMLH